MYGVSPLYNRTETRGISSFIGVLLQIPNNSFEKVYFEVGEKHCNQLMVFPYHNCYDITCKYNFFYIQSLTVDGKRVKY